MRFRIIGHTDQLIEKTNYEKETKEIGQWERVKNIAIVWVRINVSSPTYEYVSRRLFSSLWLVQSQIYKKEKSYILYENLEMKHTLKFRVFVLVFLVLILSRPGKMSKYFIAERGGIKTAGMLWTVRNNFYS